MQYFCTKCQQRHEIADIGVNLYSSIKETIRVSARDIFTDIINDEPNLDRQTSIQALSNYILSFCNDAGYARNAFIFAGNKITSVLKNPSWSSTTVTGEFTLTLGWLLKAYAESGAKEAYEKSNRDNDYGIKALDPSKLPKGSDSIIVYSSVLKFTYDSEVKEASGELLFDHVTDQNGDPLSFEVIKDGGRTVKKMGGYIRVCPHCGQELCRSVGRAPEIVVALAGVNRAGKTCCVAATISDLQHGRFEDHGISYTNFSYDYEMDWMKNEVEKSYDKGWVVAKTVQTEDEKNNTCGTYSILVTFGTSRRVLTMVDMPGEFFGTGDSAELTPEFFKQYMGLYGNIDFIWFFVGKPVAYQLELFDLQNPMDPTKQVELKSIYPTPADSPDPEIWRIMNESNDSMAQVKACNPGALGANMSIIRDGLRSLGKVMPPILVVMTKSEMIIDDQERELLNKKHIFPPHSIANFNRKTISAILRKDHFGYYIDENELFLAGSNARDVFGIRAHRFIGAIEKIFDHRFYTAISSYGHKATDVGTQNAPRPTPYNEMMPLIWTLAVSGAAKIRQGCVWPNKSFLGFESEPTMGYEDTLFNAQLFVKNQYPGSSRREIEDSKIKYNSAAQNLLFKGVKIGQGVSYHPTVFTHKKG